MKSLPPDNELLDRLRALDEQAFAMLVKEFHPKLLRVARMHVANDAVAQEVVQETWVGVLKGLERFEGRSSLKTWIFRILTNRAKTRGEREKRTVPFSAIGSDEDNPVVEVERFNDKGSWTKPPQAWAQNIPEQLALDDELRAVIEKGIATLPPNQGLVITLRDVQGFSSEETCNLLEISETNQRVLLHRARSKLRTVLAAYQRGEAD